MAGKVRASMGTLGVLGLELVQMDTPPTTAYLQIFTDARCKANCQFCAQASGSNADPAHIARGLYIPFDLDKVVNRLKMAYDRGFLRRACIQTVIYDRWWDDTVFLISRIKEVSKIPVSLSVFPVSDERYKELKKLGVDELVIPLDACSGELFEKIKGTITNGPFSWEKHLEGIKRASRIFEKVGTHLIIGLGESDRDATSIISELWDSKVNPALFSYTYVPGAQLSHKLDEDEYTRHYRNVQLARYLILNGLSDYKEMRFVDGIISDFGLDECELNEIIDQGIAFETSGCAGCNRPMANETFSKIYNFPRKPEKEEIEGIKKDMGLKEGQ